MDPLSLGLLVAFTTVLILFSGVSVANGLLIVSCLFLFVFDGFRSLELMPEIFYGHLDNFALLSIPMFIIIGNKIGAAITITATGGRKKPAIKRNMLIVNINTHRFTSSVPIHSAILCVINKLDNI